MTFRSRPHSHRCARARPRGGRRRRRLPLLADDHPGRSASRRAAPRRSPSTPARRARRRLDRRLRRAGTDGLGFDRRLPLGPLQASLYFGHFVESGGRTRPDALMPWNGKARRRWSGRTSRSTSRSLVPDDASPAGTAPRSRHRRRQPPPTSLSRSPSSAFGCPHRTRPRGTSSPPSTSSRSRT